MSKGVVNFNHKHGCQKCVATGTYHKIAHRMSFSTIDAMLRTDTSFRNRDHPDHHKDYSILEELPIDMIKDIPVSDPLHLLDHGVMRKCLNIWMTGSTLYDLKFNKHDKNTINNQIINLNKDMPSDIHRKLRNLNYIKYWKATEYRTVLLYIGMVLFKDFLQPEIYEHFLYLVCASRICSSEEYKNVYSLAKTLFIEYVENFSLIYGNDCIVSNIHNLIHVFDDVKRYGKLSTIGAYEFENCLGHLKARIQSCNLPLEQAARRVIEIASSSSYFHKKESIHNVCLKYPFTMDNLSSIVYKHVSISQNSFLSVKKPADKWFLTKDNQLVEMNYAIEINGQIFINGSALKAKNDFFNKPFASNLLDIYITSIDRCEKSYFHLNRIKTKMLALSYQNYFVFMPVLHVLDEINN